MLANSLLWQINSKATSLPSSYLYGTMHVRDKVAFGHIDYAVRSLATCSEFKSEIDLDQAQEQFSAENYLMKDNVQLQDLVGLGKFDKMRSILLKAFNVDIQHMDRILPIIIINKVTESLMDNDNTYSADSYLWHKAKELGLSCSGIENLEEQIQILDTLELEVQIKMLKEMTKNVSKFRSNVNRLCELYSVQNITALHKKSSKGMGQFRHLLINKRNTLMADRINANLSTSCFYAVGAAHLAGEKGIIALLKRKDLQLKPLNKS